MNELNYIIVGGGSAGCVLAARLTEDPALQVALLEAGGDDTSVLIHCPAGVAVLAQTGGHNWAFDTVRQPGLNGRVGYQPRGQVLGGSSSVNAMIYMRGQPSDYDAWAAAGNPGWSYAEVLPAFKRAEHNERGADAFHGQGGPLNVMDLCDPNPLAQAFVQAGVQAGYAHNRDFNGAAQEGVGMYQVTHKGGERFSAAKAYLTAAVRARPNLHIVTGARARKVILRGRQAVGVEYHQGGQIKQLLCSHEVLLCAGALQSPQLLLLSGIGPHDHLLGHGVAPVVESAGVGQHLHDHVDVVQVVRAPKATDSFGLSLGGGWSVLKGIWRWRQQRRGLLTTNYAESGGFIKTRPEELTPDVQLHFVVGQLVNHGRSVVLGHGYSCHVCLLRPKSRGSLQLASADPLAAPLIDPNFLGDMDDLQRLRTGFRLMRRILGQPALQAYGGQESPASARAQTDVELEMFIRDHADTIYHPVGSVRMGPEASDPLDAQLRVKGVGGLRVVDASAMPQIVSGNTNAPVIMMAERAVDFIRAGLRQPAGISVVTPAPAALAV
jgi:choline dehydrogenase-like flavoprotein